MYPQRGWRSESSSNNAYTRFPVRPSSLPVRQDSLARNPYVAHEASRFGETSADAYLTVAGNPYGVNSVANEYLQGPYRANDAESHFQSNQTQRTQAAASNQQPAQRQRNVWKYGIMVLVTVGAVLIVMAVGVGVGANLTSRNKQASHQGGAAQETMTWLPRLDVVFDKPPAMHHRRLRLPRGRQERTQVLADEEPERLAHHN